MQSPLRRQLTLTRSLMALVFGVSGLSKLFQYAPTLASLRAEGVWASSALLPIAIAIELAGAALLASGFRSRMAANLLAAYLVPVTWIFHDFWNLSGMERQLQLIHFLKNASLIGGLLTFSLQSRVLDSFLGGTLVQIRKETFERRRAA
jgi:putative oxidoreductase